MCFLNSYRSEEFALFTAAELFPPDSREDYNEVLVFIPRTARQELLRTRNMEPILPNNQASSSAPDHLYNSGVSIEPDEVVFIPRSVRREQYRGGRTQQQQPTTPSRLAGVLLRNGFTTSPNGGRLARINSNQIPAEADTGAMDRNMEEKSQRTWDAQKGFEDDDEEGGVVLTEETRQQLLAQLDRVHEDYVEEQKKLKADQIRAAEALDETSARLKAALAEIGGGTASTGKTSTANPDIISESLNQLELDSVHARYVKDSKDRAFSSASTLKNSGPSPVNDKITDENNAGDSSTTDTSTATLCPSTKAAGKKLIKYTGIYSYCLRFGETAEWAAIDNMFGEGVECMYCENEDEIVTLKRSGFVIPAALCPLCGVTKCDLCAMEKEDH